MTISNFFRDFSKLKTSTQALSYLVIISIFLLSVAALSLYIDLAGTRQQYEELATVIGRSIFQEIIAVRRWNAEHGGVYVPVTEKFQPNPYLEDLSRDVTTTDGKKLTKINPEYMTRLISEVLNQDKGIKIHITSSKLINLSNKADRWEEKALANFEKGSLEEYSVLQSDHSAVFRFMAPLKTESSCLNCHAKQGYKVGDIRGGISVSFSYAPFEKAVSRDQRKDCLVHILFSLIGLLIIYLLGKKLILRIVDLQEAFRQIKRLEGFLPICSHCKRIRLTGTDAKEQKSWIPIEIYIRDKTDAEFTHGLCPECLKKHYAFEFDKQEELKI
jgi:two-component system NtrC family sensor kinase